ncbi:MAG: SDR family oxidoreductase [Planctomycetes bacterium]|nr:SDR family oxidoreductase [Planctomycetota bacterium]
MSAILIIGCGYLGRRLASRCLAEGRRVFATTRRAERAEEFRAEGLEPVVCDVTDPTTLDRLPVAETVVHCVGLDRSAGHSMRAVYVNGLRNVLSRLPAPRRLLYVSSTSVYGQRGGEEVDETSATVPPEESGRVVLEAESVLRSACPEAVVLRFAGIYGPGRLMRERAIRAGEPMTADPAVWLNLIHVDDGVEALLAAEQRALSGSVFNVCDDRPVRRGDFYALLAERRNAPSPHFMPSPPSSPKAANRRVVNRRLRQELGVSLRYPDCEAGLRASCL